MRATGWRPEPDSDKHWVYEDRLLPHLRTKAPAAGDVDMRPFTSPRHHQKTTNSCVANAVCKAFEIKRIMKYGHGAHVDLSRLAVYYLARELMFPQETHVDEGTYVSYGFDVLRRFGVCPEAEWPFDLAKVTTPPSWMAMRKAYVNKIQAFYKITSTGNDRVDEVLRCLRSGHPVVFGTQIGSNWTNPKKDDVLMTPSDDQGRHATVLVGFAGNTFIGENSWGEHWGDQGFYYMAPEVIAHNDSRDFWVATASWESFK